MSGPVLPDLDSTSRLQVRVSYNRDKYQRSEAPFATTNALILLIINETDMVRNHNHLQGMTWLIKTLCRTNGTVNAPIQATIKRHFNAARHEPSSTHFYQNRQLELYASKEAKRLTLRQLVCLSTPLSIMKCYNVQAGIFWPFDESGSPYQGNSSVFTN